MPFGVVRGVVDPVVWRGWWGWFVVCCVVECVVVLVVLEWHSRFTGSIGVFCITVPMVLAAGPVPSLGLLVALMGSVEFVVVSASQPFGVVGVNEWLTVSAWVVSAWLVATLSARLRRSRDGALAHVVAAEGEERRRIAHDLHDDSVQTVVAALLRVELLPASEVRADTLRALRAALDRLRTLSFVLRPPDLERAGLSAALPQLCEAYRAQLAALGCGLSHHIDLADERYAPVVEELTHRVVLEALQNAVKHSHAQHVSVTASRRPHELRVLVTDNGRGFDVAHPRQSDAPWDHLGLQAKRERVEWAGGRLQVQSTPGAGTTVHLALPTRV